MNIKAIALMTTAFSLFAVEAYAQANHNTTRSNRKSGGIIAPVDTTTPLVKVETKSVSEQTHGHVTLVRKTDPSGGDTATGCVMFDGAADENCDGVADGETKMDNRTDIDANTSAVSDERTDRPTPSANFDNRTDIEANTSAVIDNRMDIEANTSAVVGISTGCLMPDRTPDENCDGVADDVDEGDLTTKGDDRVKPRRPRNIYQRRN